MTESQMERLKDACVIICEGFQKAVEALADAAAAFAREAEAKALCADPDKEKWDDDESNPVSDLRKRLEEMHKLYAMGEFADTAEEPEDIPPPRKIPRPAKYIGPINKANYIANRPPRVARSHCRSMKR